MPFIHTLGQLICFDYGSLLQVFSQNSDKDGVGQRASILTGKFVPNIRRVWTKLSFHFWYF